VANRADTCPYGSGDSKCELLGEQGKLGCRVSAESKLKRPMLLRVFMLVCIFILRQPRLQGTKHIIVYCFGALYLDGP
jgi:hypothetical protein